MRGRLDLGQREAVGLGPEPVAEVMRAQQYFVDAVAALLHLEQRRCFGHRLAPQSAAGLRTLKEVAGQGIVHRLFAGAGDFRREAQHDLAIGLGTRGRLEHLVHPFGHVAHLEGGGEDGPIGAIQMSGTGQHEVRMSAGFTQINVAGHHEVQRRQSLRESRAVR